VPVSGVELSPDMVARLRAKPGGDAVPVTIGAMVTTRVDGSFQLVYLLFNTIGNLETQDRQVACFANAATHLEPGGTFVIEVGVPTCVGSSPARTPSSSHTRRATSARPVPQPCGPARRLAPLRGGRLRRARGSHTLPVRVALRARPEARLAGLEVVDRWAGWDRSPFTADSTSRVSVWRKLP
jgi:hypothetical protein